MIHILTMQDGFTLKADNSSINMAHLKKDEGWTRQLVYRVIELLGDRNLYTIGYDDGYQQGREDGFELGRQDGYDTGYQEASERVAQTVEDRATDAETATKNE